MKRRVLLIVFCSLWVVAARSQQSALSSTNAVVHVSTALNHLTILEYHEPVTMAAAGSSDFQIERETNKVFVKPMKLGAATDLFVWTASRRFAYELETTEEVKNMNFAIDTAQPAPVPKPSVNTQTDQLADVVLTRALLGAEEINQTRVRSAKNQISVRVEQVFRTRTTTYIHYMIENNTTHVYRVNSPHAHQLQTDQSVISLPSLVHKQLDKSTTDKLGTPQELPLSVAHAESESPEVQPGEETQGVIAIRQDLKSPSVVQLVFDDDLKATVVL
jgi:Conjugal transfer protein